MNMMMIVSNDSESCLCQVISCEDNDWRQYCVKMIFLRGLYSRFPFRFPLERPSFKISFQIFLRDPYYTRIAQDVRTPWLSFVGNAGGLVSGDFKKWILFCIKKRVLISFCSGGTSHRVHSYLPDWDLSPPGSPPCQSLSQIGYIYYMSKTWPICSKSSKSFLVSLSHLLWMFLSCKKQKK